MKDIVINGISIQQILDNQDKVRQEAIKIISDNIEDVTKIIKNITKSTDREEIIQMVALTEEKLEQTQAISQAVNIMYNVPYKIQGYAVDGPLLSEMLYNEDDDDDDDYDYDDKDEEVLKNVDIIEELWDKHISRLYNTLQDMEYQTRDWNASAC